jgi:hypothetical protein
MSQENVEIVRRLIQDWGRGDYSAALGSIDPEIEVNVAYQANLDGTYRGHAGLAELMGPFWAAFVEIDAPAWHVWRLREGKAVRWRLLRTKQEALEAAGLRE